MLHDVAKQYRTHALVTEGQRAAVADDRQVGRPVHGEHVLVDVHGDQGQLRERPAQSAGHRAGARAELEQRPVTDEIPQDRQLVGEGQLGLRLETQVFAFAAAGGGVRGVVGPGAGRPRVEQRPGHRGTAVIGIPYFGRSVTNASGST